MQGVESVTRHTTSKTPWIDACAIQIRMARTEKGVRTRVSAGDREKAIKAFSLYYLNRQKMSLSNEKYKKEAAEIGITQ